jgi:transaldolase
LLTISPELLAELKAGTETVARKLSPETAAQLTTPRFSPGEKEFRWLLNENAMATEKLSEGIRVFAADAARLEALIGK